MKAKILAVILAGVMLMTASVCFAALTPSPATINVSAVIAAVPSQFNIGISKVLTNGNADPLDDTWVPNQAAIAFGSLVYNPTYGIFLPDCYYAVDVGVISNAANWNILHAFTTVDGAADPTKNLDDHINVGFTQVWLLNPLNPAGGTGELAAPFERHAFGSSNTTINRASVINAHDGWMRIYYGIGTGSGDATGVSPITLAQPVDTYSGSVTLTLVEL